MTRSIFTAWRSLLSHNSKQFRPRKMLCHGGFPHCPIVLPTPTIKFTSSASPKPSLRPTRTHTRAGIRTGFRVLAASKGPGNGGGGKGVLETEEYGDEYEDYDDYDDEGEDVVGGDGDDDEVIVPLRKMKQWLENKPRGFGEGKVYDTTIEDQLWEEMEQSKVAQLANINKLKNIPKEVNFKIEQKQKVSEAAPNGIRVRLVNLPKKKNIQRDLQAAFKGVPGIINIVPAVLGNKKAREPVCKGFAFVDFKSENEANRFVQMYSRQTISFGKIEKQIKCEILKSSSLNPAFDHSADRPVLPSPQSQIMNENLRFDFDMSSLEQSTLDDMSVKLEENDESEVFSPQASISGKGNEEEESAAHTSQPSKNQMEVRKKGKEIKTKRKKQTSLKLKIPGSSNRLKIKEKSLLTGVFSKYGGQAVLATQEQS